MVALLNECFKFSLHFARPKKWKSYLKFDPKVKIMQNNYFSGYNKKIEFFFFNHELSQQVTFIRLQRADFFFYTVRHLAKNIQ